MSSHMPWNTDTFYEHSELLQSWFSVGMLCKTHKHKNWTSIHHHFDHYSALCYQRCKGNKQHAAACYVLLLVCTVAACIWRRKPWCSQGGSSGRVFLLCESMSAPSTSPGCWKISDTPGRGNFFSASPLLSCASPWVVQVWLCPGCGHGGPGFLWPWRSKEGQLHGQEHSGQLVLMQLFYPVLCVQHLPDSGAWVRERKREHHLNVEAAD